MKNCRSSLGFVFSPSRVVVILLLAWVPLRANAWGSKGHAIIAIIATNRLSPAARTQVKALLAHDPDGTTLPAIASWADTVKKTSRPQTENWHFVNIPIGSRPTTFDGRRDCQLDPRRGDCLINAIDRQTRKLADARAPFKERRDALKFVTHLLGDLHQPLHCAERDGDHGGNDVDVVLLDQDGWTLHAVWDVALIERAGLSQNTFVRRLSQWLGSQDTVRMAAGIPTDWANEAHAVAVTHAYRTPTGRAVVNRTKLDDRYIEAGLEVVEQQLARAGVRLAAVLNAALR
jgi:hypothetical protein